MAGRLAEMIADHAITAEEMIREAVLVERERCAKIAEKFAADCYAENEGLVSGDCATPDPWTLADLVAEEIRKG